MRGTLMLLTTSSTLNEVVLPLDGRQNRCSMRTKPRHNLPTHLQYVFIDPLPTASTEREGLRMGILERGVVLLAGAFTPRACFSEMALAAALVAHYGRAFAQRSLYSLLNLQGSKM